MSLEDRIEKLTAALDRNSAILEKGMGQVSAAKAGAAQASSAKPVTATKVAAPKKPKGPSEDDIRSAFGDYLAIKDKTEKKARMENVRAILAHFGVSLASEITDENKADALTFLKQFVEGETPDFMNEGEGEVEEDEAEASLI